MKTCAQCGEDMLEDQKFCDGCGAPVDAPPPVPKPALSEEQQGKLKEAVSEWKQKQEEPLDEERLKPRLPGLPPPPRYEKLLTEPVKDTAAIEDLVDSVRQFFKKKPED